MCNSVSSPCSLNSFCPMDITQLTQTEPVPPWRVDVAVYRHNGTGGGHFKRLPDLNVHLKISNRAPVVRSWKRPEKDHLIREHHTRFTDWTIIFGYLLCYSKLNEKKITFLFNKDLNFYKSSSFKRKMETFEQNKDGNNKNRVYSQPFSHLWNTWKCILTWMIGYRRLKGELIVHWP